MIWKPISSICLDVKPFIVPLVPTGMKTGLSTVHFGNPIKHALALLVVHSAAILKLRAREIAEEHELLDTDVVMISDCLLDASINV